MSCHLLLLFFKIVLYLLLYFHSSESGVLEMVAFLIIMQCYTVFP